jgi:hypothetical protein
VQAIVCAPYFWGMQLIDKNLDTMGAELLKELENLGRDYPHVTKLFMDMVQIVAEHGAHVGAISQAMPEVIAEVARLRELVNEHEWKARVHKESSVPETGSKEHMMFLGRFKTPKKEDLN